MRSRSGDFETALQSSEPQLMGLVGQQAKVRLVGSRVT